MRVVQTLFLNRNDSRYADDVRCSRGEVLNHIGQDLASRFQGVTQITHDLVLHLHAERVAVFLARLVQHDEESDHQPLRDHSLYRDNVVDHIPQFLLYLF